MKFMNVMPMLLATGTGTGLDTTTATEFIEFIKSFLTLFTVYPINIFLIASIALTGFAVFRGAKRTAK